MLPHASSISPLTPSSHVPLLFPMSVSLFTKNTHVARNTVITAIDSLRLDPCSLPPAPPPPPMQLPPSLHLSLHPTFTSYPPPPPFIANGSRVAN